MELPAEQGKVIMSTCLFTRLATLSPYHHHINGTIDDCLQFELGL